MAGRRGTALAVRSGRAAARHRRRRASSSVRRLRPRTRLPAVRRRARPRPRPRATSPAACQAGEEWPASTCNRKVVAAGWWVAGFGEDRIRSLRDLSPLDAVGHGTQVASVAAGNAGVCVRMNGPHGRPVRRHRPAGPDRPLQGLLGRPRPGRRRVRDRRPGLRDRPGHRRRGRRPQPRRGRPARAPTPSSAPCSARRRPTSSSSAAAGNDGREQLRRARQPVGHDGRRVAREHLRRAGCPSPAARRLTGASRSRRDLRTRPARPRRRRRRHRRPSPRRRAVPPGLPRRRTGRRDGRSTACAAASAASTSPTRSPAPTASRWCWQRPARPACRRLPRGADGPPRPPPTRPGSRAGSAPTTAPPSGCRASRPPPHAGRSRRAGRRRATRAAAWSSRTWWPSATASSAPYPATALGARSPAPPRPPPGSSGAAALLRARHDWRRAGRPVRARHHRPSRWAPTRPCARAPVGPGADVRGARLALVVGTSRYREALEAGRGRTSTCRP